MACNLFFYQHIRKFSLILFCSFLALQVFFQLKTEYIKPNLYIVPPVPNDKLVDVASLGDKEFYFRILALKIQNAGDTFGRLPPLKDYDYEASTGKDLLHEQMYKLYDADLIFFTSPINFSNPTFYLRNLLFFFY